MNTRRFTSLLMLGCAALSGGCSTPRFLIEAENARTNTHVVLAFEETVFNKHHVHEGFNRYVSIDYKEHAAALLSGFDEAENSLSHLVTSQFPDSRIIVKRTVSQGDLVAVHALWDQQPGQTRGVATVDIYRLTSSKIVEHWQVQQAVLEGPSAAHELR